MIEHGCTSCIMKSRAALERMQSFGIGYTEFRDSICANVVRHASLLLKNDKVGEFAEEHFALSDELLALVPATNVNKLYEQCETAASFDFFLDKFIDILNIEHKRELAENIKLYVSGGDFSKARVLCTEMMSDKFSSKIENEQFGEISKRVFPWEMEKGSIVTGFKNIDEKCGLIRDEEVVIIAGRPGDGKTSMGCQIALSNARLGKKVQFFSLEMSKEMIVEKLQKQLLEDRVREQDHDLVVKKASELDLSISEESNFTRISSICKIATRQKKLDLVIIDYAQIIRDDDLLITTPDLDKIPVVMERMNCLAKQLHCPIIAMAQLNRSGEKEFREPILADLAGSSAIEKWAHRVIMLYRPIKDQDGETIDQSISPNPTIVKLPKNRNSSKLQQYMLYHGEVGIFREQKVLIE